MVYFYGGGYIPVYALLVYAKSAKTDLDPVERRVVAALVEGIKSARKERR